MAGAGDAPDVAIVIDRQGAMRMFDPVGWTLPAICAEFGATAAYRVERRGQVVRVEGCGGGERCILQRELLRGAHFKTGLFPVRPPANHAYGPTNSVQKYYPA